MAITRGIFLICSALAASVVVESVDQGGKCEADGKDIGSQCGVLSQSACGAQAACVWDVPKKCVGDISRYDEPCGKINVEYGTYTCDQQIACKVANATGRCIAKVTRDAFCAVQNRSMCAQQIGCTFKDKQCLPIAGYFALSCCGLTQFARFTPQMPTCADVLGCVARSEMDTSFCTNMTDLQQCQSEAKCMAQEVCKWKVSEPTCVKYGMVNRCLLNAGCFKVNECVQTVDEASFCASNSSTLFVA